MSSVLLQPGEGFSLLCSGCCPLVGMAFFIAGHSAFTCCLLCKHGGPSLLSSLFFSSQVLVLLLLSSILQPLPVHLSTHPSNPVMFPLVVLLENS